jgi:hypothetical protein
VSRIPHAITHTSDASHPHATTIVIAAVIRFQGEGRRGSMRDKLAGDGRLSEVIRSIAERQHAQPE